MERIIYVDASDNIIGSGIRGKKRPQGTMFRVSALWLTNSKDEILIAKRAASRKINPNKWGPAVSGTVEETESYEENIIKESEEEIGFKLVDYTVAKKYNKSNSHFTQFFKAKTNNSIEEFTLGEEVAKIKWISKKELRESINKNPDLYLKRLGLYLEDL